jgi:hypothetical protein
VTPTAYSAWLGPPKSTRTNDLLTWRRLSAPSHSLLGRHALGNGSSHPPLFGHRELVVSFDSHRHKAMFSCFYTAGHKGLLGRFRSQRQTTCLQNSGSPTKCLSSAQVNIWPWTVLLDQPVVCGLEGHIWTSAGSQPGHNLPESAGSCRSPKDTSLVGFVFAKTTRESVGHLRTRPRHGSGP